MSIPSSSASAAKREHAARANSRTRQKGRENFIRRAQLNKMSSDLPSGISFDLSPGPTSKAKLKPGSRIGHYQENRRVQCDSMKSKMATKRHKNQRLCFLRLSAAHEAVRYLAA